MDGQPKASKVPAGSKSSREGGIWGSLVRLMQAACVQEHGLTRAEPMLKLDLYVCAVLQEAQD